MSNTGGICRTAKKGLKARRWTSFRGKIAAGVYPLSLSGLILGIINLAIVVVALLLVGAIGQFILTKLGWPADETIVKLYIALVALVALYMLVALIFGLPTVRIIG